MKRIAGLRSMAVVATAAAALALGACAPYPPRHGPPYGAYPSYYYDYYYYPHADVYFHIYTGEYYYRSGGHWQRAKALPRGIYLDPHDRRQLHIRDTRQPYRYQQQHRETERARPGYRYERSPRLNQQEREHNRQRYDDYRKRRQR